MHEFFPIVAGVVIVLTLSSLEIGPRFKTIALVALSVVIGALASWVSGELSESWVYLAFDMAQVLLVAGMTTVLVVAWRRRAERFR